jgi:hypothetical protein
MLIVIATILLIATNAHSQSNDSIAESGCRFKPTQLILPVVLIGTGVSGLTSDWMDYQNHEIKDELRENIDKKSPLMISLSMLQWCRSTHSTC